MQAQEQMYGFPCWTYSKAHAHGRHVLLVLKVEVQLLNANTVAELYFCIATSRIVVYNGNKITAWMLQEVIRRIVPWIVKSSPLLGQLARPGVAGLH